MLHKPKNLSWPSCIASSFWNVLRQPPGAMKGKIPSNTSIRASADQKSSLLKRAYFLEGAAGVALPRNVRKKSDDDGSMTITSPFLPKLAMYACRLR